MEGKDMNENEREEILTMLDTIYANKAAKEKLIAYLLDQSTFHGSCASPALARLEEAYQ